jgi:hypothetical protein
MLEAIGQEVLVVLAAAVLVVNLAQDLRAQQILAVAAEDPVVAQILSLPQVTAVKVL